MNSAQNKMLQKRLKDRAKMVVPVRLFAQNESGVQVAQFAHTLDANPSGARLGGFHGQLQVGQTVTLQYQHRRCDFLVVWIGESGTQQSTQLGLKCLEPNKNIWNIDFDDVMMSFGFQPQVPSQKLRYSFRSAQ